MLSFFWLLYLNKVLLRFDLPTLSIEISLIQISPKCVRWKSISLRTAPQNLRFSKLILDFTLNTCCVCDVSCACIRILSECVNLRNSWTVLVYVCRYFDWTASCANVGEEPWSNTGRTTVCSNWGVSCFSSPVLAVLRGDYIYRTELKSFKKCG
jgi:hypothetical protein